MRTLSLTPLAEGSAGLARRVPYAADAPLPAPAAELAPQLARFARNALIEEARLTPKPALVDARGSGAHNDLDLATMLRSAHALEPTFEALARASRGAVPGAAIVYTPHASDSAYAHAARICETAASIARFDDLLAQPMQSHGERVRQRFNVGGARSEAQDGFPHVVRVGLPALHAARAQGCDEAHARVDALLAIMASLDDTCVLHRAGLAGREAAQAGAQRVRDAGGVATQAGRAAFDALERALLALNASPGGAADLLAATLFIDRLVQHRMGGRTVSWNN